MTNLFGDGEGNGILVGNFTSADDVRGRYLTFTAHRNFETCIAIETKLLNKAGNLMTRNFRIPAEALEESSEMFAFMLGQCGCR